jgi:hypothetical protein
MFDADYDFRRVIVPAASTTTFLASHRRERTILAKLTENILYDEVWTDEEVIYELLAGLAFVAPRQLTWPAVLLHAVDCLLAKVLRVLCWASSSVRRSQ